MQVGLLVPSVVLDILHLVTPAYLSTSEVIMLLVQSNEVVIVFMWWHMNQNPMIMV